MASARPQPAWIRIVHWVNVPVIALMAMSGLQIFVAYPHFGAQGEQWAVPWADGWTPPDWLRAGQWLAGARHLHFAVAWVLLINAAIYAAYLLVSGEWMRRYFWPPRDIRPAFQQLAYYLRLRKDAPPTNLYNSLQRSAYTAAMLLGLALVLSGLVMWKPVQLGWLGSIMGGYDGARFIHFATLVALAGFVVTHVAMVLLHPRALVEMITGGKAP
jgi:thiosulfate reductase cytochrome b subunit